MKIVVISGASSGVGKTTLARNLQPVLEGSEVVKIGHGRRKLHIENHFYDLGTPFETIRRNHSEARWLLIESNAVLREIQPDLVIYLEGENPKASAEYARQRADIISGQYISRNKIAVLAVRLDLTVDQVRSIVELAGGVCDPASTSGGSG